MEIITVIMFIGGYVIGALTWPIFVEKPSTGANNTNSLKNESKNKG